jgi:hypothetical protein
MKSTKRRLNGFNVQGELQRTAYTETAQFPPHLVPGSPGQTMSQGLGLALQREIHRVGPFFGPTSGL